MDYLFSYCSSLASLNVSGWNTAKVTSASDMFLNCSNLAEVTLGYGFYASNTVKELPSGHKWVFRDNPSKTYTSATLKTAMRNKTASAGTYIWATDVYTVEFEGGGESVAGSMELRTVANLAVDYVIPENRFVNPGYAFTGWTAKSGEDFKLEDGRAVIPAGTYGNGAVVILIAQWEEDPDSEDPGPGIDPGADPGFQLPDTGGTGEWLFRSAGIVMILAAGALLYDRRHRYDRA